MHRSERRISSVLRSRGITWLMIAMSLLMGWIALGRGVAMRPSAGAMWLPSASQWISDRMLSAAVNVLLVGGCCVLMALVNKVYNLLRTVSLMFVGLFAIILAATPALFITLGSGLILTLCTLLCVMLLYSIYQEPYRTRRVFLVFFILACGCLCDYAFVPYLAVFLVGCSQVRCLNLRTLLAAFIGIITPVWILWGVGLLDLSTFSMPQFSLIFKAGDVVDELPTLVCVGITLCAGMIIGCVNLMKIIAFNARSRAFCGLLCMLGIVTGTLCIVDFNNIAAYAPLLDCCTAFQAGLFMRLYEHKRAYLVILLLIILYCGCYIWSITV